MKHFLRDKLNTIRVPRHIQELSLRINTFTSSLTQDEVNELTNDVVAEALNVTPNAVTNALQADRRKSTISLDEVFASDSDNLGYEEIFSKDNDPREIEDTKLILRDVIEKLPNDYREIVKLFYYEDLNQKEISEKLNINPMQVSRKLKKAFSLLYKMIADSEE